MKKLIGKISALLLALTVLVAVQPVSVFAAELETETSQDAVVAIIKDGDTTYEYTTLEAALTDAYPYDNVILTADYTLTNSSVVIPANVQVTIPTSASYDDTVTGNNANGAVTTGSAYATLTIPADKKLTVNGTLLVAGNQQSTQPQSGCLTGNYGEIVLDGDINIQDGGKLYARGKISGSGTVTANNGSTIYQMLQIKDWRGGTAALSAYNKGIFPFNLYEFNNITATTIYKNGSALFGQAYIYAGNTHNACEIPLIGANGQLSFVSAASVDEGNITVTHSDGVATAAINGNVQTGDITVSLKQYGITVNIRSATTVCPFGYNMNVVISNGASLNITNNLKFLPGCTVSVADSGTLTVASDKIAYFYADGGYSEDFCYHTSTTPSLIGTGNAFLTAGTGTAISGTIASTSSTLSNTPYATETPVTSTVQINEATQSGSTITTVPVTFYTYTVPSAE